MDPDISATDIQQQMHAIRRGLRPEVNEIVDSAKALMSWQHYVVSYPWASLGVAAAVGYVVVPRRIEVTRPDPKALERIARNSRLVLETDSEIPAKPTLLATAFALAGSLLVRAGLTYAGRQAGRFFESSVASRRQMESVDDRLSASEGPSTQRNRF